MFDLRVFQAKANFDFGHPNVFLVQRVAADEAAVIVNVETLIEDDLQFLNGKALLIKMQKS